MKINIILLLFFLISHILCEKELPTNFETNELDSDVVLQKDQKTNGWDVAVIVACRGACEDDHGCLNECIRASHGN